MSNSISTSVNANFDPDDFNRDNFDPDNFDQPDDFDSDNFDPDNFDPDNFDQPDDFETPDLKASDFAHSTAHPVISRNRTDAESHQLALTIAQAADDRKGVDIALLRVSDVSYLADYFVVVTGFSNVQVRAIARSIQEKVETEWQQLPLRIEGQMEGSWVLIDYGDVIAHIFLPNERQFYNLEAFWGHAEQISFALSSSQEIR